MTAEGQGSTSRLNSARMQQGSAENADRLLAERRSASSAVSHSDSLAEVYEERAKQKERDQNTLWFERNREQRLRELEDPINKAVDKRFGYGCGDPGYFYDEDDPRWISREDWEADKAKWEAARDRYEAKLVGDDLAKRITNRKYNY